MEGIHKGIICSYCGEWHHDLWCPKCGTITTQTITDERNLIIKTEIRTTKGAADADSTIADKSEN